MNISLDNIFKTFKQLVPTGRVFRINENSNLKIFLLSFLNTYQEATQQAYDTLNQILPDNSDFSEQDATQWEKRLGLTISPISLSLEQRKALILRKYAYPSEQIYRQNKLWFEYQLHQAGFTTLFVHEKIYPDDYFDIVGLGTARLGQGLRLGLGIRLGQQNIANYHIVANSWQPNETFEFGNPENAKGCFFIGGEVFGDYVDIDDVLEVELRKLILLLKPSHTVAVLFINFINTNRKFVINDEGLWDDSGIWYDDMIWEE